MQTTTQNSRIIDQPDATGLSLAKFTSWMYEIMNQPAWRSKADKEMDYVDGNQLDSEILQRQRAIGMPPAIEPLIGPAIDAVLGLEAKTRTDWRITHDGDEGEEVAAALNFKVNQAERKSGADKACSDAFKPQLCVGIGWLEVARESDPFKYPYRCTAIHRNEIFWDMLDREPGLPKARYLVRRRWSDASQIKLIFPKHADLIDRSIGRWNGGVPDITLDGGTDTNLAMSWIDERGWTIEEQEWRDWETGRVCMFEVWYRRWESVVVLRLGDGRIVEYNQKLASHVIAVAQGYAKPQKTVVARMYQSFWLGPHKLHDGPTPYRHSDFPYVQFVGKIEDRTGIPKGVVRDMIYMQDSINSAISKIRWGLSSVRTIRTKGAVVYSDEIFRQQVARIDADIVLDAVHMAKPGAKFEVQRDFQLNEQQYKMLQDSRLGIQRCSGITAGFAGQQGNANSGVQESTQIEQATQSLASLMDNFKFARTKVGELLMSLIIEDMLGKREKVMIKGNGVRPDRTVELNVPQVDADTGMQYLDNDVERVRLKVAMNDVPSTPSFRTQQLAAMSEAFKSMPPQYQEVALPHLLSLMDVPNREELLDDIKNARDRATPEQIQQRIDEAVALAMERSDHALRGRELDLKYNPDKIRAEVDAAIAKSRDTNASAVEKTMRTFFASGQTAQMVAAVPALAPLMDALAIAAGYQPATPVGVDPNIPQLGTPAVGLTQDTVSNKKTGIQFMPGDGTTVAPSAGDTSPTTPANPAVPASPMTGQNRGIETATPADNLTT